MAVAQRMYARALFQAAQEAGRLDEVAADLGALAGALADAPELAAFLRNPQVEPAGKAAVLGQLSTGADDLVRNFLRLVADKGRTGELAEVNKEFEELVARAQNRLTVELQTAQELTDEEAESIIRKIESVSGRTVDATRSVDPSLIGGIVLQVGSFRADGSVRGRLERLRQELVTSH